MTTRRTSVLPPLILGAFGVSVLATAVLVAFPGDLRVWQAGAWTLALGLLALSALVAVSGYLLATRRNERTGRHIASFALGLVSLAIIAIGSL